MVEQNKGEFINKYCAKYSRKEVRDLKYIAANTLYFWKNEVVSFSFSFQTFPEISCGTMFKCFDRKNFFYGIKLLFPYTENRLAPYHMTTMMLLRANSLNKVNQIQTKKLKVNIKRFTSKYGESHQLADLTSFCKTFVISCMSLRIF